MIRWEESAVVKQRLRLYPGRDVRAEGRGRTLRGSCRGGTYCTLYHIVFIVCNFDETSRPRVEWTMEPSAGSVGVSALFRTVWTAGQTENARKRWELKEAHVLPRWKYHFKFKLQIIPKTVNISWLSILMH